MHPIYEELKSQINGDIHFDSISKHVYSVDASIFEIEPLGIVLPKSKADLLLTLKIAHHHHIPITARGAATGITGGCLGTGIIIDTSKYLNKILNIDIANETVTCEPGVVQDDLNAVLDSYGYRLGPDTSTGNRATLGGMLANNAAGARSLRYGKMVDHVISVEVAVANGEIINFHPLTKEEWKNKLKLKNFEGHIYEALWHIQDQYREEILKKFPNIPRRVSGYNLDELIKDENINVSKLIVGSEGTLGIVTSMTLKIVPKAKASGLCVLHFNEMIKAMQCVPELLKFNPMALEVIDDKIIEQGRLSPSLRGQLNWLQGNPKILMIVELEGTDSENVISKLNNLVNELEKKQIGYARTTITDVDQISKVWALRKSGLGILLSKRSYSRAIAFLEDITVSPYNLAGFMEQFCAYLQSKGKTAGFYGHVGSGCMHIRPYIDLRNPDEIALMRQMMCDISDLLLKFGGALSGEHGDGLIRSWLNPRMFGEKIMQAFIELKTAFDPDNLMNPGKIVHATEHFDQLRLSPTTILKGPETFLNFDAEGGFELAVDLCNGNGQCRKKTGVMCPSFQVTNDEFHTTRARAQALRDIIQGRIPLKEFTSQGIHDVMDLCISCKGCKTECPSQVDMAKMKAEFLYHYQEEHGVSFRTYLFGYIGKLNKLSWPFAKIFNHLQQSWFAKKILNFIGITTKRTLPKLANEKFSNWFKNYQQLIVNGNQVVLFNDTFTEYNDPQIGQAAVRILNELGYEVITPQWTCCGRPMISKGLLKQARNQAEKIISLLLPYAKKHIPIIGLEPSCILTIKDDFVGLVSEDFRKDAHTIHSNCFTLDEFLARHLEKMPFPDHFRSENKKIKVHGHCHQKALVGMESTLKVLRSIPGFDVKEIDSGCCGMAGSFGYEKEHFDISMQMGELKLFPAVRSSEEETIINANGTSCRHQINDGTGRKALHLAEILLQTFS
ncbi:MAG: FAD-binding protein [Parachlamydiaceae bacterium]|nr:FAD-binding protein [Parachlamydiaceae bacterium]